MLAGNTRSNVTGAVGATLPFVGAALGLAAIAGATGCHMEVLVLPFALIGIASIAAIAVGVAAVRMRRSKRGLVMPVLAICTGLAALGLLASMLGS